MYKWMYTPQARPSILAERVVTLRQGCNTFASVHGVQGRYITWSPFSLYEVGWPNWYRKFKSVTCAMMMLDRHFYPHRLSQKLIIDFCSIYAGESELYVSYHCLVSAQQLLGSALEPQRCVLVDKSHTDYGWFHTSSECTLMINVPSYVCCGILWLTTIFNWPHTPQWL